jgi:hypothetical protein
LLFWIDQLLAHLNVHHITPIKEAWVLVTMAVFLLQVFAASFLILTRRHEAVFFEMYLLAASIRDLGHYFSWWGGGFEGLVAFFTVLATTSASIQATYSIRGSQRRYARHAVAIFSGVGTCLAAYLLPTAYPGYSKGVYFIRLYTNTFCALTLAISLVYICKNWNFKILRDPRSIHATIMMVWFGTFVWADRHMEVGDAWFPTAMTKLAIQGAALVAWIALVKTGASKEEHHGISYRG